MPLPPRAVPASKIGSWVLGETLGSGSFGTVFKATHESTREEFACKVVPKYALKNPSGEDHFQRELSVTAYLRHPNLVSLHEFLSDASSYYLVMDLCPGGQLFNYVTENRRVPEPVACLLFHQIVAGLSYSHSQGVAHRDLKLENILFTEFPRLKISDFGFCGVVQDNSLFSNFYGTACYAAPECFFEGEYDGRISDIWSLGVILYGMVTGDHPWPTAKIPEMIEAITEGRYSIPPYVTANCRKLIEGLLQVDPAQRLTWESIFAHPWLGSAAKCLAYLPGFSLPELGGSSVGTSQSYSGVELASVMNFPHLPPVVSRSVGDFQILEEETADAQPIPVQKLPSLRMPVPQKQVPGFKQFQRLSGTVRSVVAVLPPRKIH
jgi:serine/threonine protein kinase